MDSNHRSRKTADLQSAPFGHSGICPLSLFQKTHLRHTSVYHCFSRASCRIRTNDPEITNHVLWPTELKRRRTIYSALLPYCECKCTSFFLITKLFRTFFSFLPIFFRVFSLFGSSKHQLPPIKRLQKCRKPWRQTTLRNPPANAN